MHVDKCDGQNGCGRMEMGGRIVACASPRSLDRTEQGQDEKRVCAEEKMLRNYVRREEFCRGTKQLLRTHQKEGERIGTG